jgi:hypothetical protein
MDAIGSGCVSTAEQVVEAVEESAVVLTLAMATPHPVES